MRVEIRVNGRYQIELQPETPVERAVLLEMSDRAGKGQPVKLATAGPDIAPDDWKYCFSVEASK